MLSGVNMSAKDELISSLLSGGYLHSMYQGLFDEADPFLTHLSALLYHSCRQGITLPVQLHEEYVPEMARNLLYEASQISYNTLVLTYASMQPLETCERLP